MLYTEHLITHAENQIEMKWIENRNTAPRIETSANDSNELNEEVKGNAASERFIGWTAMINDKNRVERAYPINRIKHKRLMKYVANSELNKNNINKVLLIRSMVDEKEKTTKYKEARIGKAVGFIKKLAQKLKKP